MTEPLILTALLDDAAQARFDRLRRAHFPAEHNHLAAHVTLFHALPADQREAIDGALRECLPHAPVPVTVIGVRSLGRGVAFVLGSPDLAALRAELAWRWQPWLSPQDRTTRDLHVTVQNRVQPAQARTLHAALSAGFVPETVPAIGLSLWRYLGGPWAPVARYPFA